MGTLTKIGLVELALAGLSGWVITATVEQPRWFAEHGVRNTRRFLQCHLDWVMMGLILIATNLAVPDMPDWIAVLVAAGAIVNPLLFLPLAWDPEFSKRTGYRVVTVLSFACMSTGLPALAIHAIA